MPGQPGARAPGWSQPRTCGPAWDLCARSREVWRRTSPRRPPAPVPGAALGLAAPALLRKVGAPAGPLNAPRARACAGPRCRSYPLGVSKDPFAPAAPARPGHQPLAGFAIVVRKAASGQGLARLELASAGKSISVQSDVGGEILSPDPMDQFWNPYSYVGGNPLTGTDPWGLESEPLVNPQGICVETSGPSPGSATVNVVGVRPSSGSSQYWSNVGQNFLGAADVLSFGIGPALRSAFPIPQDANIDYSSIQYRGGTAAGVAFSLASGRFASPSNVVRVVAGEGSAARGAGAEIQTTVHGAERIAGASATRGGVLTIDEIKQTKAMGRELPQADGAKIFLFEVAPGRFNAVVQGEKGLITTMANWSQKSINRIARNHGWKL